MGFSHTSTFLVKVLSDNFCKAGFACNVQFSSLGRVHTWWSYSPLPAPCPDAGSTLQPPALPLCWPASSGRNKLVRAG